MVDFTHRASVLSRNVNICCVFLVNYFADGISAAFTCLFHNKTNPANAIYTYILQKQTRSFLCSMQGPKRYIWGFGPERKLCLREEVLLSEGVRLRRCEGLRGRMLMFYLFRRDGRGRRG